MKKKKAFTSIATLFEGVLNDDYIEVINGDACFGGDSNKKVAIHYFLYATEWTNTHKGKSFESVEKALKWYEKEFRDRAIEQGKAWLYSERDEENDGVASEIDEAKYKEIVGKYTDGESISKFEEIVSVCLI